MDFNQLLLDSVVVVECDVSYVGREGGEAVAQGVLVYLFVLPPCYANLDCAGLGHLY